MNIRPLHPAIVPLAGFQAIEASAGTGKTWSIAALYLRLVLEQALPVERILVVTYTKAATAELRRRIRERLVEARSAFQARKADFPLPQGEGQGEGGVVGDPVLSALLTAIEPDRAVALLTLAIESFDLAAVHTIHGFCQRALAERAFESGQPFDAELMADEAVLLREAARDFWRRELDGADPAWSGWLLGRLPGPEALLTALRPHLGKPYLDHLPPPPWDADAAATLVRHFAAVGEAWRARGGEIVARLSQWPKLSQTSYKPAQIAQNAAKLDAWFAGAVDDPPLKSLELFTPEKLAKGTTKGGTPPEDPLFLELEALRDAVLAVEQAHERRLGELLLRALQGCETLLAERKASLNRLSFDDLLNALQSALVGPGGEALAVSLRTRYGAALIDEFQDTDPVQYAIFERVFRQGGHSLFFVGDPKQAIYGFRGADLQTYLEAREQAGEPWALATNRRSVPSLVQAVNALFARQSEPFLDPRLGFVEVAAVPAEQPPLLIDGAEAGPFDIWFLPREGDKPLSKGAANERIAAAVAADIARLLNLATRGQATVAGRPLCGGDIAVLVKGHRQGKRVRDALVALNVASVRYGQESVFHSREAMEVERLLLAVAEPGRLGLVKAALATDLLGRDGAALHELEQDGEAWERELRRFHDWNALCRERGFVVMWRSLLVQEGVAPRLLAWPDGERRMTNLQHLSELLQQLAHDEGLSADGLAARIAEERQGEGDGLDAEARLLRLENDEQLVRIVTIHSSKGLEYPLVYCPFLWDGGKPRERIGPLKFHDPAQGGRAALDFGSAERQAHAAEAEDERRQELLRLAYVALTRAKQRCVIAWGAVKDAEMSALAWLLHGADPEDFAKRDDAALKRDLEALRVECPAIAVNNLPTATGEPYRPATVETGLAARPFTGSIAPRWLSHSFTGWMGSAEAEMVSSERPDHDAAVVAVADETAEDAAGIADFPRGAQVGSALHFLFEHGDFARFDAAAVPAALRQFGIDERWAPQAARLVMATLEADLGAGLRLNQLPPGRQMRELEFLFPIAAPDPQDLAAAIGPGQGADGHLDRRVARLQPARAAGFLKGFIDLACEHEDRLWLLDYKSNWLGSRRTDYGPEGLATAMAESGYDLQSLIYTVALHRLQKLRRPDYDYARHMGGVLYLFLRGLPDAGVFRWQPDQALVERVDACLTRQERWFA
ncbi:exodeoxyribonuclease V subunit beta [Denitratisoma oestradiolicum]|uniref:RecBCD enzyme subunit RecB n=1 Tax=Denitratisoma oestradiolicum TaxID=311182 RepID=A0A6S6Y0W6_9PROT|nr:exodeoxyribonuclease V subunit beta [Denitratisoma oestradiolicum]TWO81940.1 exodeoxyribonuclease V subunit beta [Denitratisoma oestradiolicum]CAB1368839.1 RecBCD enzyme subunit RecB [Denitratisoma oestradiolicum]